jgi:quinol monooxygenase YgiN
MRMSQVGLLVRLKVKAGQEATVAEFLKGAAALAEQETGTVVWVAYRIGSDTFGIFDINPSETGRQAHLAGQIAATIMGKTVEWLIEPPQIEFHDVLSTKFGL